MDQIKNHVKINNTRVYLSENLATIKEVIDLNAELKSKNIRTVFILLTEQEIKSLYGSVGTLIRAYQSIGIHVEFYPIPDDYTLQYNLMLKLSTKISGFTRYGNNLFFHCSTTKSRAILAISCTLINLGMTVDSVLYYMDMKLNGKSIDLGKYVSGFLEYMRGLHKNDVKRRPAEVS